AEGRAWRAEHPSGAGATARASGRSGDHPVVAVTFWEAEAYCAWRGGALPGRACLK
ncbi:MAG: SUMF1/EgtB/PvdO family nonheme iron enzyme, partial [Patescibacteria group bacterium]